jgi:VIT1/CCC1 family predicted Fe2+/Mn2+ transporter
LLELNSKYSSEDKLTDKTEKLKDEINALENEINNQIYKLYGITEEEKKVIEDSLR